MMLNAPRKKSSLKGNKLGWFLNPMVEEESVTEEATYSDLTQIIQDCLHDATKDGMVWSHGKTSYW